MARPVAITWPTFDRWLRCETQEAIAEAVGLDQATVARRLESLCKLEALPKSIELSSTYQDAEWTPPLYELSNLGEHRRRALNHSDEKRDTAAPKNAENGRVLCGFLAAADRQLQLVALCSRGQQHPSIKQRYHVPDISLMCCECKQEFVLSDHEQQFYEKQNLQRPKRCKACRDKKKKAKVTAQLALLFMISTASACGVSPSAPTTPSAPVAMLEGTWSGTITIAGISTPTTWEFSAIPQTAGHSYATQATWQGTSYELNTSLLDTGFQAAGPLVFTPCADSIVANGRADAHHVESDWTRVTCHGTEEGRLTLSR